MRDRPIEECERIWAISGMPCSDTSSGWVTSNSMSRAEKPGASVWTCTCGGANSGKTSTGIARIATSEPPAIST